MDCSLGVCLVERDQQDRLKNKVQREHPNIPGARLTNKEDRGPLHIVKPTMHEQERAARAMVKPTYAGAAMQNNYMDAR